VNGVPKRVVLGHHHAQAEPIGDRGRHWRAQDAAPVLDGEVDHLRRRLLGSEHQVALVLALGVVHHDDHLPGPDAAQRLVDGDENVLRAQTPA
jgi:hypothetical protein